jgi:hypothetical protein
MTVKLSPIWSGNQFFNSAGSVLSGGKILQYQSGTTTPTATYTDSTGLTPNANPIILDSAGRYSAQIWFTAGTSYKLVLQDSSGSTILTEDNLTGINDGIASPASEWQPSNLTPTYISATSFSVPGNQTATFAVRRRLQSTVNAGTVYSTVVSSSFSGVTTVTVSNDAGTLDVGLSVVNIGLLNASNTSFPVSSSSRPLVFAYSSTVFALGGNTFTNFTLLYDLLSNFNATTGIFTVPFPGKYFFNVILACTATNNAASANPYFTKNASPIPGSGIDTILVPNGFNNYVSLPIISDCVAGDLIAARVNTLNNMTIGAAQYMIWVI